MSFNPHFSALALLLLLHYECLKPTCAVFKFTKVNCSTIEPNLVNITKCVVKPVRRDVSELSVTVKLSKPVYDFSVHFQLLRKYNTYEPFLYSGTYDVCSYLKYHNNYQIMDMLYAIVKPYTNLNHSCPLEGEIIFDKVALQRKALALPWPSGDYSLRVEWYFYKKLCLRTQSWAVFTELEHW